MKDNIINFPLKNGTTEDEKLADVILKYLVENGEDPIIRYIVKLEEEIEYLRKYGD